MCFSACLLARFFCLCMYTHGARMLGAWVRPPSCEQKVQECKQEEASLQRAMISELGGLAPPKRSPLSLSLSPFSRACIRVPPPCTTFYFPASCLDHISWVWQCLFYFSCTLLGHTLVIVAMSIYFLALCYA